MSASDERHWETEENGDVTLSLTNDRDNEVGRIVLDTTYLTVQLEVQHWDVPVSASADEVLRIAVVGVRQQLQAMLDALDHLENAP